MNLPDLFTFATVHGADAVHATGAHPQQSEVFAPDWLPMVTSIVVFLIVLGVLWKTVWPKISAGLDEREEKIRQEIAAAEAARARADAALKEYETSLARAREEANDMIATARTEAKRAGEELRSRNEQELASMRQRATEEIESAKKAAIVELHHESASLAAAMARKILQREITADDQRGLMEESLREMSVQRN